MKKFLLIIGIIFITSILGSNSSVKAADSIDSSNLSAQDQQAINNYLQKQKEQKQTANTQNQTNGTNTNTVQQNTNTATLSKWAIVLVVLYVVTLVLFFIALILSIIALSRWLKRN
jgi:Flp pilus assembly protein TadB